MAPSSSPSSSQKLLITDPKPKSGPNSASSSSIISMPPPPPEKRTRDQPNLSDCHCCGHRINHTNPKDRLKPLDSLWRIVLLCRKCCKSVYSGKTCTYCFRETGNSGDLFTCRVCENRIHKDCVKNYGNCTPWCYMGVELEGFRVCVDCWVPELLKNSIAGGRSESKGGLKDKCDGRNVFENAVQEVKCNGEEKVKRVPKATEQVLRRANEPSNEGASDVLAKKDKDSLTAGNSNCSDAIEVVDDADLAIQLHRVINSSPRILWGKSLVKSASSIRDWKGLSYKRSGVGKKCEDRKLGICANIAENERMNQPVENDSSVGFRGLSQGLMPYKRDRKRKIWLLDNDNTLVSESMSSQQAELNNLHSEYARTRCSMKNGAGISEVSNCLNTDLGNSCINGDLFRQELLTYKRTRFKQKVCQVSGLVGVSWDSSSCDSHRVAFKSECHQSDYANLSTGCLDKCGIEVILPSGGFDGEQDRYLLKYVRRIRGTKLDSCFPPYGCFLSETQVSAPATSNLEAGYSASDGELILPNGTNNRDTDRYYYKYVRRVKSCKSGSNSESPLSNAFLNKIDTSAAGVTANCSAESRTLSDASFDSFTIDLPK